MKAGNPDNMRKQYILNNIRNVPTFRIIFLDLKFSLIDSWISTVPLHYLKEFKCECLPQEHWMEI
jgi:hypothetical protein